VAELGFGWRGEVGGVIGRIIEGGGDGEREGLACKRLGFVPHRDHERFGGRGLHLRWDEIAWDEMGWDEMR
jgi:hypothetical protein